MKRILLVTTLILATSVASARSRIPLDQQIGSITTIEIKEPVLKDAGSLQGTVSNGSTTPTAPTTPTGPGGITDPGTGGTTDPGTNTPPDRIEQAGKVISAARDMVALGEAIYDLVKKGKPTNVTDYAPISVVPKDPATKDVIDPFQLEGFSMPVQKNFQTVVHNGAGKAVVQFNYKVLYSYGGSYNGKGKYLTGVIIVPSSIRTSFGWDFSASMKVSGIMNHGTKDDPVAGVMITVKYQMNSWSVAFERNDTIHLTGRGELKTYAAGN